MDMKRRSLLHTFLFGAGAVGLRSLATGVPVGILSNPRRALAAYGDTACFDPGRAQFLVLSTSSQGDPLNANAPGSYVAGVAHPDDPNMAPAPVQLGAQTVDAARPWTTLPPAVLARACFFHHSTLTNNHANQPKVMRLMGKTKRQEMVASIYAKQLAGCLQTIQPEPVVVGALNSNELLTFDGRTLPRLSPTGLREVLAKAPGPLTDLQALRDESLDKLNAIFKEQGTNEQRAFLDRVATSRRQAREIPEALLDNLSGIADDDVNGQIVAAAALIKMKVAPVVSIHIPFGGDNHRDPGLANEAAQTVEGVASIDALMQKLGEFGLSDQVTFALMNVFGRTLTLRSQGRAHHADHHVSVLIGKGIRPGVVGGLAPLGQDFGATDIDSASGRSAQGADISVADSMSAMAKTLGSALGIDPAALDENIEGGKIVTSALA